MFGPLFFGLKSASPILLHLHSSTIYRKIPFNFLTNSSPDLKNYWFSKFKSPLHLWIFSLARNTHAYLLEALHCKAYSSRIAMSWNCVGFFYFIFFTHRNYVLIFSMVICVDLLFKNTTYYVYLHKPTKHQSLHMMLNIKP